MPIGSEDMATAFFSGLLGFTVDEKPQPLAARGGCWFSSGDCKLHLGTEESFSPQKKAHPAFLAEDVDLMAQRLHEEGYPVSWDNSLPNRRRFYTEDPFGNRIEIMKDGDGFSQDST